MLWNGSVFNVDDVWNNVLVCANAIADERIDERRRNGRRLRARKPKSLGSVLTCVFENHAESGPRRQRRIREIAHFDKSVGTISPRRIGERAAAQLQTNCL